MEPVLVDRFAGSFGESIAVKRPVRPDLRPYVRGYAGYHEHTAFRRRREAPTGAVTMIIDLGDGIAVLDPACPWRSRAGLDSFVAGPADRAFIVDSGGWQTGLQIDLTLVGARLLLNRPLREVTNRVIGVDELLGSHGRRLVGRLRGAGSWHARFELLDGELGALLEAAPPVPPDLEWTWQTMIRGQGQRTIRGLADEVGCSRKHLTARFSTQFGLPPKTIASILRFRKVIDGLERGKPASLADLAATVGYYDQAHLNRDFRRFAGITPTEYRRLYTPEFGVRAA